MKTKVIHNVSTYSFVEALDQIINEGYLVLFATRTTEFHDPSGAGMLFADYVIGYTKPRDKR